MERLCRTIAAIMGACAAWTAPQPQVNEIVARSVANNQADWKAAPQFTFKEQDIVTKNGRRNARTYRVLMIEGSQYQQLIGIDGKPLDSAAAAREEEKHRREVERRKHESPSARAQRIAQYEKERRQDHELMREMVNAFAFHLAGTERINGRQCYRVEASPKPGYVPHSRETKVLAGMRGVMWIDTEAYQWVKVIASVFRPVAFGLFFAKVQPGTEFVLEEGPVEPGLWMPLRLQTRVKANVLVWNRNSEEDDTFSEYRRLPASQGSSANAESPRPR